MILYYEINFLPLILTHQQFSSFNLKPSIIFCLSSGDVYIYLSIFSSFVSELSFEDVFETLVI